MCLKNRKKKKNNKGFTLIEIMIVLAIVGLLFSFVGVNVLNRWRKAQRDGAKVQIAAFDQALQAYYLDNNRYPNTQQGLDALISKPTVGKEPRNYADGGYMKKLQKDPWGNPYNYVCDDYKNYTISSNGPDEEPDTEDDISSDDDSEE